MKPPVCGHHLSPLHFRRQCRGRLHPASAAGGALPGRSVPARFERAETSGRHGDDGRFSRHRFAGVIPNVPACASWFRALTSFSTGFEKRITSWTSCVTGMVRNVNRICGRWIEICACEHPCLARVPWQAVTCPHVARGLCSSSSAHRVFAARWRLPAGPAGGQGA